jgi:2-polyprenyl-3-methyl-5-hydroxy-6-metoxy-1,4-benzoquinol methylase
MAVPRIDAQVLPMSPHACEYSDDGPTWSNNYLWDPLVKLLGEYAAPGSRIFELGCGNGATARMLQGLDYEVIGVDPSQSGIALAGEGLYRGSTEDDLSARFGHFPVVISMEVIEHCPSTRDYMATFASLLAPGGIGVISTPYHGWLKTLAVVASGRFDSHFDPLWEGGHVKFFSIATLTEAASRAGLEVLRIVHVGRVRILAKSMIMVVRRNEKQITQAMV